MKEQVTLSKLNAQSMNKEAATMKIVFLFYEGMTALDAIGPHEILCRLPDASVFRNLLIYEARTSSA